LAAQKKDFFDAPHADDPQHVAWTQADDGQKGALNTLTVWLTTQHNFPAPADIPTILTPTTLTSLSFTRMTYAQILKVIPQKNSVTDDFLTPFVDQVPKRTLDLRPYTSLEKMHFSNLKGINAENPLTILMPANFPPQGRYESDKQGALILYYESPTILP
jgi:hypothetical protein